MNRNIDQLGRIVIPKEMRNKLGLNNGDQVKIELVGDSIIKVTNPTQEDKFELWLKDYVLMSESVEANKIYENYKKLKK